MRLGVAAFLTDEAMAPTALAAAAEERGFHSLYLPEHTHLPRREAVPPSLVDGVHLDEYQRSLDPLVALGAAAAVTSRIRLGTGVLLVAQHDPILLAKQVATLDHVSGGRVVLGIGYGWNRSEAEDHGVDFGKRRAIAREHVLCMQALWSEEEAEFHGEFVSLDPCYSRPKPVQQPRVPLLVGGAASPTTFAAIAEYADGWLPIGGAGVATALPDLRRAFERQGRDPDSVDVVPFGTIPSEGKLDHYRALGLREVVLRLPSGDDAGTLRALDRLAIHLERVGGDDG